MKFSCGAPARFRSPPERTTSPWSVPWPTKARSIRVFGPAMVSVLEVFTPRPPGWISRTTPLARVKVPW